MDALLASFVATFLAGWGDSGQLIVAALAARSPRPLPILLGALAAALVGSLVAAGAGVLVGTMIVPRAAGLLVALALLFAGLTGLFARARPSIGSGRLPLALTAFLLCLAAEIGDRTQFLVFALAARLEAPLIVAAGAVAGSAAVLVPGAWLGSRLAARVPVLWLRRSAAALFLVAGFWIGVSALRLV